MKKHTSDTPPLSIPTWETLLARRQRFMEQSVKQAAAGVISVVEACLQPVAEGHEFIDLGDDAVVDAWSRRVVGWAMATHLRAELVLEALNMALWQRQPEAVIHHSDQGCQYTSIAFGLRCCIYSEITREKQIKVQARFRQPCGWSGMFFAD